jgi:hypothetical protein
MIVARGAAGCDKPIRSVDLHYFPLTAWIFILELTRNRMLPDCSLFCFEYQLPAFCTVCRNIWSAPHKRENSMLTFGSFRQFRLVLFTLEFILLYETSNPTVNSLSMLICNRMAGPQSSCFYKKGGLRTK